VLKTLNPEALISPAESHRILYEDSSRLPTNIAKIINGDWRGWFKYFKKENPLFGDLLADQCVKDFCYTECFKHNIGYDLRVCIIGQKLCIEGKLCAKLK